VRFSRSPVGARPRTNGPHHALGEWYAIAYPTRLRQADGAEAAWWFGLMTRPGGKRATRALRILTEAVR